jgi:hypothetical protein
MRTDLGLWNVFGTLTCLPQAAPGPSSPASASPQTTDAICPPHCLVQDDAVDPGRAGPTRTRPLRFAEDVIAIAARPLARAGL